jgi:hypothetical protein
LRFHLEQQVEKYLRQGLTREEAARRTRLQFGGLGHVKENCRESRGVSLLQTTVQDIRSALRQLKRSPAFTTTVLLTLALGIGANAAIFTLVNAVLLKSLPVTDPKTLIRLGDTNDCCVGSGLRDSHSFFSTDQYEQLKKGTSEFEELAAMQAGFGHRPVTGPAPIPPSVLSELPSRFWLLLHGSSSVSSTLKLPSIRSSAQLLPMPWGSPWRSSLQALPAHFYFRKGFADTKPSIFIELND